MTRVLLGFSGGIDSTAAAGILSAEGHDVTLLWLRTIDAPGEEARVRAAAEALGLPLVVEDVREEFEREVISYFVEGYQRGQTPAPCTVCNPAIKWKALYRRAEALGIDHIATGHYFRVREHDGRLYVSRAADPVKDQSYYLWNLPQQYLRKILTPMADRLKRDVMAAMSQERPAESMGVCFLRGCNYGDFLRGRGVNIRPGDVVDKSGAVVGRHDGYQLYTIGQKRGFDAPAGYCVVGVDAASNRLIAGTDADLYSKEIVVGRWSAVYTDELISCPDLSIVVRGYGRNPGGYASVSVEDGLLRVTLDEPAWAVAAGQPIVFYCGERVLGGGFVENYF